MLSDVDFSVFELQKKILGSLLGHDCVVSLGHLPSKAEVRMDAVDSAPVSKAVTSTCLLDDFTVLLSIPSCQSFEARDKSVQLGQEREGISNLASVGLL